MKQSYKRRPNDFCRKILKRNIPQKQLHEEEYKWLRLIKKDELGKKYYNLHNHHFGHWSTDEQKNKTVGQKISSSPMRDIRIGMANKGRKPAKHTIEATIAVRIGKTFEEFYGPQRAKEVKDKIQKNRQKAVWSEEMRLEAGRRSKKHMTGRKLSEETKKKMSESQKISHGNRRKIKHNDEKYI